MADYYGDRTIPNRVKPGGDLGTKEYFYTADKKTGLISVHRIVTSNNAQDDVTIGTINPNAASITVNQNASAAEIAHWRKPNNIANAKSTAANVAQKEWSAEPIGSRNPQSPKSQILKTDSTPTELTSTPTDNKKSVTAKNTNLGGTKTGGFGHLRYPKNINETQRDVLIIDMLEYVAQGIGNLGKGKFGIGNKRQSNRKSIGSVVLPIPAGIQATNTVGWQEGTMTAFDAGLAQATLDVLDMDFASLGDTAGGAVAALKSEDKSNLSKLIAQQITNNQGIITRETGQILNPNMELLFNSPTLRDFSFDYKLSPRNTREASEIQKIVNFFKRGMAPIRTKSNLFLKSPMTFRLQYRQRNSGNKKHPFLNAFKECALTSCTVQFTPDGNYSVYRDGSMTSYKMQLAFRELEPIFNDDYETVDGMGY